MTAEQVFARKPESYETFKIAPGDNNRMALIADPIHDKVPFTAIVEFSMLVQKTPPNSRSEAFEMFYVLSGTGIATCNRESLPVASGDSFVVRPGSDHIVENTRAEKLYCVTVMIPNEGFAELIRAGKPIPLDDADLAVLLGPKLPYPPSRSRLNAVMSRSSSIKPEA